MRLVKPIVRKPEKGFKQNQNDHLQPKYNLQNGLKISRPNKLEALERQKRECDAWLVFSNAESNSQKNFPKNSQKHIFSLKIIKKTHFY